MDSDGDDAGEVWNPTDVGYVVAPGRHHVQIDAPGCASTAFDMDAYADRTQHAVGRLAVADASLGGPAGAPDGFGLMVGLWHGAVPMGPKANDLFGQTAAFDAGHTTTGGVLSLSAERRHFALAVDLTFADGAVAGEVSGRSLEGNVPTSQPFSGSAYASTSQLRIGGRVPLHEVALEAGSGLGLQWWITSATLAGGLTSGLFAPSGIDGSFYLPLWLGAEIKPACDWGVQVLAQYDVHPMSTDTDDFEMMAGVLYQPSASCSEPAGVHVAPN